MRLRLFIMLVFLPMMVEASSSMREEYECELRNVEVAQLEIFMQIDSIIRHMDILATPKAKPNNKIDRTVYALSVDGVVSDTAMTEGPGSERIWIQMSGVKKNSVCGEYYFDVNGRHIVSEEWFPQLFKCTTDKVRSFTVIPRPIAAIISEGTPIWLFKVTDGKVVEGYYTFDEGDDFRGVVYDILNYCVVSEGDWFYL